MLPCPFETRSEKTFEALLVGMPAKGEGKARMRNKASLSLSTLKRSDIFQC
jgi:hypothetical protein